MCPWVGGEGGGEVRFIEEGGYDEPNCNFLSAADF